MRTNPVGWFELYVQDADRARNFYETVLQTKLERLPDTGPDMWVFPMAQGESGAAGALVRMDGVPSGGGGTLIYFVCDDCAVEEGRVVAAGGSVQRAKFSIGPYGFISHVVDTEGNLIGLHSGA